MGGFAHVKRPVHRPAASDRVVFPLRPHSLWWRMRNTDLDLWLTLVLLPAALAFVFLVTYGR